jgi:hypothetical protein
MLVFYVFQSYATRWLCRGSGRFFLRIRIRLFKMTDPVPDEDIDLNKYFAKFLAQKFFMVEM